MMPIVDEILSHIGTASRTERITEACNRHGMSFPAAITFVDGEIQYEIHCMLRALLMMHGRNVGKVSDAEATHNLR